MRIVRRINRLIKNYKKIEKQLNEKLDNSLSETSTVVGMSDADVTRHNARQTVSCLTTLFVRLFFSGDGVQSVANDVFAAAAEKVAPGSIKLDGWLHDLMVGTIHLLNLLRSNATLINNGSIPIDQHNMLGLFYAVLTNFINHLDTLFHQITILRAIVSGLSLDVRVYKPNASGDYSFHKTVCFLGNSYASHGIDEANNPIIQDNLNAIFSSLQAALNGLGKIYPRLSTTSSDKGYQTMRVFLHDATSALASFTGKLAELTIPQTLTEELFNKETTPRTPVGSRYERPLAVTPPVNGSTLGTNVITLFTCNSSDNYTDRKTASPTSVTEAGLFGTPTSESNTTRQLSPYVVRVVRTKYKN